MLWTSLWRSKVLSRSFIDQRKIRGYLFDTGLNLLPRSTYERRICYLYLLASTPLVDLFEEELVDSLFGGEFVGALHASGH